jgi:hypothetical protein
VYYDFYSYLGLVISRKALGGGWISSFFLSGLMIFNCYDDGFSAVFSLIYSNFGIFSNFFFSSSVFLSMIYSKVVISL